MSQQHFFENSRLAKLFDSGFLIARVAFRRSPLGLVALALLVLINTVLLLYLGTLAAEAQQAIHGDAGTPFMEEVTDGKSAPWHSVSTPQQPPGQLIRTQDGSMFMEEVPQKKKTRPAPRHVVDYSNLGVPVDSSGKIIPLIQPGGAPVIPNVSRMEIDYTPGTSYIPYSTYSGPYGFQPQRTHSGTYAAPVYQAQQNGVLAVPMGIPRSYSSSYDSSSSSPVGSQQTNFQFSGSYLNGIPGASIWSPGWHSPWGGTVGIPQVTQFEQKGTIRSLSPQDLNP